jgi:phosphoglycolate phosphatase-like HAD superfamily hydrolase
LFALAAHRLNARPNDAIVVGDAIWDHLAAKRLGSQSVGVLTGGYARNELYDAGAVLVYQDAAELATHLEDLALGAPRPEAFSSVRPEH